MKPEKRQRRRENRQYRKHHTVRNEPVVGQATLKHARFGPMKARLLADLIRDKTVGEAENILRFTVKPSTQPSMIRLLKSAVSNVDRERYSEDAVRRLVVGEVAVDSAMIIKRFRPRAMGRMNMIRKRTCHVSIRLTDPMNVAKATPGAGEVAPAEG